MLVLFGLPIGSWVFLKGGLEWRKEKLKVLTEKGRFISSYNFTNQEKDQLFKYTASRTALVKLGNDMTADDHAILDQFKKAYTFMFVVIADDPSDGDYYSSKIPLRYVEPTQTISSDNFELSKARYLIVDTNGMIRQVYADNDYKEIVEDLTIVLPRKPKKDIEMQDKKSG